jgi:hypothetical protein|tara:strand:- start:3047 stop:3610 length:564 start_codon:yes stop_codon:yes gene_type:complete
MANVSSYTFDNMSRIGNDSCSQDQNTIQSVQSCNYMLENYKLSDCGMKNPIEFATQQPGVNYSGSHSMGVGGCNVDNSSKLLLGSTQTNPKCRIDLFQRPFATVPFLGRGAVDPIMESQIQQGEMNTNKRTVTKLTEKSYLKYNQTPLIPSVKERVTNAAYSVEGAAAKGWIRGGAPSREMSRDNNQ